MTRDLPATSVLDRAVAREAITGDGKSGNLIERLSLDDGTRVVVKHLRRRGDWISRRTGDDLRVVRLWENGVLARVPLPLDHGMLTIEEHDDGVLVVMRDVTAGLVHGRRITRHESRRMVHAAAALHDAFRGEWIDGLCPLVVRYTMLGPGAAAAEPEEAIPQLARRGWEIFAAEIDGDVGRAVLSLLDDPTPLVERLATRQQTLIHGDLKQGNISLEPDRVVFLDWGTQTGMAPPAVEWAWYLALGGNWIEATREETLDDCRAASGVHHDEDALDLALLGALVQLGWNKALDGFTCPDLEERARERADLEWWVATAARVLDRHGVV